MRSEFYKTSNRTSAMKLMFLDIQYIYSKSIYDTLVIRKRTSTSFLVSYVLGKVVLAIGFIPNFGTTIKNIFFHFFYSILLA